MDRHEIDDLYTPCWADDAKTEKQWVNIHLHSGERKFLKFYQKNNEEKEDGDWLYPKEWDKEDNGDRTTMGLLFRKKEPTWYIPMPGNIYSVFERNEEELVVTFKDDNDECFMKKYNPKIKNKNGKFDECDDIYPVKKFKVRSREAMPDRDISVDVDGKLIFSIGDDCMIKIDLEELAFIDFTQIPKPDAVRLNQKMDKVFILSERKNIYIVDSLTMLHKNNFELDF